MSEPGQRWAPFPVQDWSTLPPAEPVDTGWGPDPAWAPPGSAPPGPSRPWWVPLVVLLCLGLVVGTGTWLARRDLGPRTAALAYVPADGDASWQRVDRVVSGVAGETTQTSTQVAESALFRGSTGLISADAFLVERVLHQDHEDDPSGSRLWRTQTTAVDGVGLATQTVRYYRVRGSVELAGERAGDGTVTAYEPALVELPADVRPGSTWTGTGAAGDTLDYTSTFRAAAAPAGCLRVTGELELRARGTQQVGQRRALTRTWCAGRGMVEAGESLGATRTEQTATDPPAPDARTTTDPAIAWTDPAGWSPRSWDTVTVDPAGDATRPMYGAAQAAVHPVLTAAGLVVRTAQPPGDLVATTPKTSDAWTPAWTAHPGGTVLSVSAFGAVVLVTTSRRSLVAYSDAGARLWQASLPEIGATGPVRVSDDDAVLVDLSGRVRRFGIADGAVRWQRDLSADVNRAPAVGTGLVVVADRGGTVTALDAATGASRWDRPLEAAALAVVGDRVVVVADQDVLGLEPATGRTRSLTRYAGQLTGLTAFAGRPLVVTRTASLVLDGGRVVARLPGYLSVDVTPTHLVGWSADRLDVLDPAGRVVATWPTRSTSLISSARPGLVTPQGVYLFADTEGWRFDSWTTGG